MKRIIFLLLAAVSIGAWATNTTTTVTQVTEGVELTDDVDYVITSTEPFTTAGSVNIVNTDKAVVIFKYVKPSVVISSHLGSIYINGEAAVSGTNCTVQMYDNGAIVFPYTENDHPLTCYTEEDFGGESYSAYNLNNSGGYMQTLSSASLNNNIRSFKLRRGYMVTFAVGTGGWGYQRCFIADMEDLEVSSVPVPLNGKISSYRLFHWYNAQKKGLASDTDASTNAILGTSWCYSWGLGWNMLPDVECVPNHIYEDWPSSSSCGGVTYSCHLKTNNEPGNSSDDTPQTVDVVLANWQNLMRTGLRLCSESSHDGSMSHLKAFIDSVDARGGRCDLQDRHFYWAAGTFNSLTWYSNYYGNGRPIWISEWVWGASWNSNGVWGAVSDASSFSSANQTAVYNGTKPILDVLNSNTRVERYAYWNSESVASKIYYYGTGLSTLGTYYASMESGLGYNADEQYVPQVVWGTISDFEGSYNKKKGIVSLSWSDSNGDMVDSIVVQCKLPDETKWTKLCNVTVKDKSSSADVSYSLNDTISDPGIYYYRVVDYYNNKKTITSDEYSVTVAAAKAIGALQYGQLELASEETISTDIEEQSAAPYLVTGMVTNKNTSNGVSNHLLTTSKSAFKFRLYPWQLTSAGSIDKAETVSYLSLPADTVMHISDDMTLQTGTSGSVSTWTETTITFAEAYPEGTTPVVVAQYQTTLTGYEPAVVKVYDITNEGFKLQVLTQEGNTATRKFKVYYYACTPGQCPIGEGKLLTAGRNESTAVGGSSRQVVSLVDADGNELSLQNAYVIAGAQTHNYPAMSVMRQHSTTTDDDGGLTAITVRRQVDDTKTTTESNTATPNGDYIGGLIISDDTTGETDDLDAVVVPASIGTVEAEATASSPAYDLSGRRATEAQRGLVIKDGRKVVQ